MELIAVAFFNQTIANRVDADGLTRERRIRLSKHGAEDAPSDREGARLAAPARRWLARLEEHERSVLDLLDRKDRPALERVVELDPAIPPARRSAVVTGLIEDGSLNALQEKVLG